MRKYDASINNSVVYHLKYDDGHIRGELKKKKRKLEEEFSVFTRKARKSLSKLCPIKMVLSENLLSKTACTSRMVVLTFSKSSSVIPLNRVL